MEFKVCSNGSVEREKADNKNRGIDGVKDGKFSNKVLPLEFLFTKRSLVLLALEKLS